MIAVADRRRSKYACENFAGERLAIAGPTGTSDPCDVVITDRRQNPTLPTGVRWTFYAAFASPLKAAAAFGVGDIKQLRQQVYAHGYHRVRVERMLRRA